MTNAPNIENQKTEFKSIWKDEFLKYISAFANTNGGMLYVGLSDSGKEVGLLNSKKLLEDIPNKAIQFLGTIIDVTLHGDNPANYYLSIEVKQSPTPIAYKGKYYIRSGSTIQELKGVDLHHFILKKLGKGFDELPMPSASLNDIDFLSVKKFIDQAIKINRLSIDAKQDDLETTLLNLNLIDEEGRLKNAALLVFGKNTLQFFSSVSFRLGRFGNSHHDLIFQDVVDGNIYEMPERVMEVLKSKYLTMPIRYEGLQRIEELEYPEQALREAILNSIIHKDYTGVHIQLSVYDDKIILWNPGVLPSEIRLERIKEKHPSIPRNKLIADLFFKAGYIEAWGRGIHKIINDFSTANLPEPVFENYANGVQVTMRKDLDKDLNKDLDKDLDTHALTENQQLILKEIEKNKYVTQSELAQHIGINDKNIRNNIKKLKDLSILQRVGNNRNGYWLIIKTVNT